MPAKNWYKYQVDTAQDDGGRRDGEKRDRTQTAEMMPEVTDSMVR